MKFRMAILGVTDTTLLIARHLLNSGIEVDIFSESYPKQTQEILWGQNVGNYEGKQVDSYLYFKSYYKSIKDLLKVDDPLNYLKFSIFGKKNLAPFIKKYTNSYLNKILGSSVDKRDDQLVGLYLNNVFIDSRVLEQSGDLKNSIWNEIEKKVRKFSLKDIDSLVLEKNKATLKISKHYEEYAYVVSSTTYDFFEKKCSNTLTPTIFQKKMKGYIEYVGNELGDFTDLTIIDPYIKAHKLRNFVAQKNYNPLNETKIVSLEYLFDRYDPLCSRGREFIIDWIIGDFKKIHTSSFKVLNFNLEKCSAEIPMLSYENHLNMINVENYLQNFKLIENLYPFYCHQRFGGESDERISQGLARLIVKDIFSKIGSEKEILIQNETLPNLRA